MPSQTSQLSILAHQLHRRRRERKLARLLDLGLEDDFVALLPHLRDERLARDDRACEADFDVAEGTESKRVVLVLAELFLEGEGRRENSLLIYGLSGYAEEAKAMQDGRFETAHLGE
jgi:hypothetical protein